MTATSTTTDAAAPAGAVVATLAGVSRTFGEGPTAVQALHPTDLELHAGELVVILGPSGSGKTTLLNILGAISRPSTGTVTVAGHRLDGLDRDGLTDVRRDAVGFVFQFSNLIPSLTARENVALIAELAGDRAGVDGRVAQVLADVGLAGREGHFPGQLSGGEQQRVAIARALVKRPTLLVCDEPTGALDVETGRTVLALLWRQAREEGRTVLIVTHNAAIAGMADRVVRLRSGAVVGDERNPRPVPVEQVDW